MKKYDSYVICTSPRSGSTLLCNLLAKTGVAGNPESYFHRPSISSWLKYFKMFPHESSSEKEVLQNVFAAAIAKGTLETAMFGLRLQRHSFDFFIQKLAVLYPAFSGDKNRLCEAFGRTAFIHLTRLNKVEQAVSYVIAEQSGLWHVASDGSELERVSPAQTPNYDPVRIEACVEEMTIYDCEWKKWFESENISPLRITYEALAANPIGALGEVLYYLGLDSGASSNIEPGVAKMADRLNQVWVARFRSGDSTP